MAVWRKHRFLGLLETQDKQDEIMAGLEFSVHYVGSTVVKDDFGETERLLGEFLKITVDTFQRSKHSKIQLVVDISGAVFYDNEGITLESFKLQQIRDVIHCDHNKKYGNYFMLVGQAENDLNVKAHILVCENKQEAEWVYKTFVETFKLSFSMTKKKTSNDNIVSTQVKTTNEPAVEITSAYQTTGEILRQKSNEIPGLNSCLDNNNNRLPLRMNKPDAVPRQEIDSQGNSKCFPDDDFTKLARSRSRSSNTSVLQSGHEDGFSHGLSSPEDDSVFW